MKQLDLKITSTSIINSWSSTYAQNYWCWQMFLSYGNVGDFRFYSISYFYISVIHWSFPNHMSSWLIWYWSHLSDWNTWLLKSKPLFQISLNWLCLRQQFVFIYVFYDFVFGLLKLFHGEGNIFLTHFVGFISYFFGDCWLLDFKRFPISY